MAHESKASRLRTLLGGDEGGVERLRLLVARIFERRFGVRTSDYVYLEDLGLPSENRLWHDASEWISLKRVLSSLNVTRDDVFIDFGSGLGRVVLLAARHPFGRVIGVELSEQLNEVAKQNIERNLSRLRCRNIDLIVKDALDYEIPKDVTVAYFFSPFTGEIFARVADKLFESFDRNPRRLRIVYNYPVEHKHLISTRRVQVLDVSHGTWPVQRRHEAQVIVTYLVLPRGVAPDHAQFHAKFPGAEAWLGPYDPGFPLRMPPRPRVE